MKKIVILYLILLSIIWANNQNSSRWNPKPIEKHYSLKYDRNTTCLVRNILVYKAPKWIAKIELRNGKIIFFSSPKSMFEFYHRPANWYDMGVRSERDFHKIVVTNYKTVKPINGEDAFYVYGSRAISPAGDDLPAFATREEAEDFAKKYNGKRVLPFEKVSDALIRLLNGSI
jgi:nitrous oxide reductase accessory protein NosL